ncbi:MAG: helix-turn-helix transcriptional regulator [Paludibacteraceae bacterium]|nr:helix-turn-helix transcriptional regulator [Paludibacteraceae bacterium]
MKNSEDLEIVFKKISSSNLHLVEDLSSEISKNMYSLFICDNGRLKIMIEGVSFELLKGDVCIYTPGRNVSMIDYSHDLSGLLLGSSNDRLQRTIYSVFNVEKLIYLRSNPTLHLYQEQLNTLSQFVKSAIEVFKETSQSETDYSKKLKDSLVNSVCYYILHLYSIYRSETENKSNSFNRSSDILKRFLVLLFHNYIKERSVEFYASQIGLSKRYFSTMIKSESGKTPKQWIEQVVIEEIKHYLSNPNMPIKEIAYHFNFTSQSFFGKFFKESVGISPKEYRQNLLKK